MFITKKNLKRELQTQMSIVEELAETVAEYEMMFPFMLDDVVFDVQLRNNKGRFTKTRASREYSTVSEVVVTKKNYFNLVDRLNSGDVFLDEESAWRRIDDVCID